MFVFETVLQETHVKFDEPMADLLRVVFNHWLPGVDLQPSEP